MIKPISNPKGRLIFAKGSEAIANLVADCQPGVVAAYPITPQTGIIEQLVKLSTSGQATFSFVQAESEYSAISIALGAAATGVAAYTATSSQGLLHMIEVVYNLPGLRLPVVMTCANRSISSPINIWNDHQDAMAVREAGWLMFFAENNQEAIEQHWLAFILSQKLNLPVMVNVDGFRLTHASEPIALPTKLTIKKILKNSLTAVLDTKQPKTTGHFTMPQDYQNQRLALRDILAKSGSVINKSYDQLVATWQPIKQQLLGQSKLISNIKESAAFEYYGPNQAKLLIVAMGSIIGELKDLADQINQRRPKTVAILKIKLYRPFPSLVIKPYLKKAKRILVIDRSPGLGGQPPLFMDIQATLGSAEHLIHSLIVGLGGAIDLTELNEQIKLYVK